MDAHGKIKAWLSSTEKDYWEGVKLLGPLIKNKYLLHHLARKQSAYNWAKLARELQKVLQDPGHAAPTQARPATRGRGRPRGSKLKKVDPPGRPQAPGQEEREDQPLTPDERAAVEKLEVALGKMHDKKGILSNSLRDFEQGDAQGRARVLGQIAGLNSDMEEIRAKLAYQEKTGHLPPLKATPTEPAPPKIPDDPLKMKQTLLNLRSTRTKINRQLKQNLAALDLARLQTRLTEKETLITEIERRLNNG